MVKSPIPAGFTRGFTLIELVVVLAIVALLLSIAAPRYFHSVDTSKEKILKATLVVTRDAIDKYYGDHARYPDTLEALVEKKYLRTLPYDPLTESSTTWAVVAPERSDKGGVLDIHSGADGVASDGVAYREW